MAGRYVMTPARRAALKKAQLASARKRRKGGLRRTINKEYARKNKEKARKSKIASTKYAGAGGVYKQYKDRTNSTGPYSKNWRGRKYGKGERRANKIGSRVTMITNPGYAGVIAGSYINGRRKGTIKKKAKKRSR